MHKTASPLAVWAGIVVLYVVWGSTYLGMKLAIDTVPPFVMGFLRFVPAGLLLAVGVAVRDHGSIRRPSAVQLRDVTIVGALPPAGRHGPRRLGRADRRDGHRRAPHRARADVAGRVRTHPVR